MKFCRIWQTWDFLLIAPLFKKWLENVLQHKILRHITYAYVWVTHWGYRHNRFVSQLFSPSGEKQCILAYKSEQLTISCVAIFNTYCCYIKLDGIITNLTMKSFGVCNWYIKISQCGVYGASISIYYVLCPKTIEDFIKTTAISYC